MSQKSILTASFFVFFHIMSLGGESMKIFQDISTLKPELAKEIAHNDSDMKRFYTLTTEERQDILGRISEHNSLRELEKANGERE